MGILVLIVGAVIALICAWLVLSAIGLMTGERPGGLASGWWDIFSKMGSRPSSYAQPPPDFLKPRKFFVGDNIRVLQVPLEAERALPGETRELFQRCVGNVLRVERIDEFGALEVHVLENGAQAPDRHHHILFIDPQYAEIAVKS
jgi:hypothetical protein